MTQRTIKFRAWDTKKRMMTNVEFAISCRGSWLTRAYDIHQIGKEEFWRREKTSRLIPMQFTGVLDEDNGEIYENDIIKYKDIEILQIVWSEKKLAFVVKNNKQKEVELSILKLNRIEIIGNIYENPELLK